MSNHTLFGQCLTTERLTLEPLKPEHAEHLFSSLQDDRIYQFIPTQAPTDLENLKRIYALRSVRCDSSRNEVWLNWAARITATGEWIGLFEATVLPDHTALVAYTILPIFWSLGYAREGLEAVLYDCLASADLIEAVAEVDTRNEASIRLLERLGFTRTGEQHDVDFFRGATSHEYTYRLRLMT